MSLSDQVLKSLKNAKERKVSYDTDGQIRIETKLNEQAEVIN